MRFSQHRPTPRLLAGLIAVVLLATALVGAPASAVDIVPADTPDKQISSTAARWFRIPQIPMTTTGMGEITAAIDVARESGYNGMLIGDSKINWYSARARGTFNYERWEQNLRTIMTYGRDKGLDSIVSIAPIGRCNAVLANDPQLSAGFPLVTPVELSVDGTKIESAVSPSIVDGDFSAYDGRSTPGWRGATPGFTRTQIDGNPALRNSASGWSSVRQDLNLVTNTQYTLSVKVRADAAFDAGFVNLHVKGIEGGRVTDELSSLRMSTAGPGRGRNYDLAHIPNFDPATPAAVDWVEYKVAFNSLDHTAAVLWIEISGQSAGSNIWFDDIELAVDNTLNLIGRPGLLAPDSATAAEIDVVEADGTTWTAFQGVDFELVDPSDGGRIVASDERIGELDVYHEGPTIRVVAGSRLTPDVSGRALTLRGYHSLVHFAGSVACSWNDPALFAAVTDIVAHAERFNPDAYLVPFDEVRSGGHERYDLAFDVDGSSAALANTIAEVTARVRPIGKPIYIWNDMIDTQVNAVDSYYHVRGSLAAPESVPSDVTVLTWSEASPVSDPNATATRATMLANITNLANKQIIAAYYDRPELIEEDRWHWVDAWDIVPDANVAGAIYTTWHRNGNFNLGDYRGLADFAELWWGSTVSADAQQPFASNSIPGVVEAEHFDTGGAGVAYRDVDDFRGNGSLRADESVDVYRTFGEADHTVGRTRNGEWLEYSVDAAPGDYEIVARVASGYDFSVSDATVMILAIDGVEVGRSTVGNTGDWWSWTDRLLAADVALDGTHVVRVTWDGPGFVNFDHLEFTAVAAVEPPPCHGLSVEGEAGAVLGEMKILPRGDASGSQAIGTVAGANKYTFDGADFAEFCVTAPASGNYTITARVIAPDRRSDSLWVQINDAEPVLWHIRHGNDWHDVDVRAPGARVPAEFDLAAGQNTLRLFKRETGTLVDSFRISG